MNRNEIFVLYGNRPREMVKELLSEVRIEDEIDFNRIIIGL